MENEYIILPKNGFKSAKMKELKQKRAGKISALSPLKIPVSGGSVNMQIKHSLSADGLKVGAMTSFEARQLRRSSDQYRILPVRKYKKALTPLKSSSRKALSEIKGSRIQTRIFVKEEGTDKPLSNVVVIAIVNSLTNAGVRRRTGITGQITITLPQNSNIEQLFVYPPPGYWGKYLKSPKLKQDGAIFLKPIESNYTDFLRHSYKTPRKGSGKGVRVAVIDSGVDQNHKDLKVQRSFNCVRSEDDKDLAPSDGHGTHVAGIIASKKHGIAPDSEIYSFKVFPHNGKADNVDIADAIDRAVDENCDLINLSLGGGRPDEALSEAIGYAFERGTVCIAAAGNEGRKPVSYPAWFKRCIAVSALGRIGTFPTDAIEAAEVTGDKSSVDKNVYFARFSNQGHELDVCAPGVGIVSTWLDNGIAAENGTSMACPIVTAVGAALLAKNGKLLSMERGVARSMGIVQLIQKACNSVGLLQIYQGLGQPGI